MIDQITLINGSNVSDRSRVIGGIHLLRAIIVSHTPELISNLTLVASPELNGLSVQCNSASTGEEVGTLQIASKFLCIYYEAMSVASQTI